MVLLKKSLKDEIFQIGLMVALISAGFLSRVYLFSAPRASAPSTALELPAAGDNGNRAADLPTGRAFDKYSATPADPAGSKIKGRWVVDYSGAEGSDVRSVTQAIRLAKAGDRIEIRPGVYNENFIIKKDVTLIGSVDKAGKPTVVVEDGTVDNAITIYRGKVSISNITVVHRTNGGTQSHGIYIDGGVVSLSNVSVSNYEQGGGLYISDGAVHAVNSSFASLGALQTGIFLVGGELSCTNCSTSNNKGSGVVISHWNSNAKKAWATFKNLTARNNGRDGIYIHDDADVAIDGCTVEENLFSGVEVADRAKVVFTGCRISGNGRGGVETFHQSQVNLTDVRVFGNQAGITSRDSSKVILRKSFIFSNEKFGVWYDNLNNVALLEGSQSKNNKLGDVAKIQAANVH